jgi:glycosyltransferase involved in cell wall biosynthesis
MNYLFIHQDYPGQFKHLVVHLAERPGDHVVALVDKKNLRTATQELPAEVKLVGYETPLSGSRETHRYLYTCEAAVRRGQQILKTLIKMKEEGYVPDFICAHIGWGESLFLKELYPDVPVLGYFEFFYRTQGADVGFDREFYQERLDDLCRIKMRNAHHLLAMDACDWGLTPTAWQAKQLPAVYLPKVSVIHEGIDTEKVAPTAEASFKIQQGPILTRHDKVVTFVNRNLEPYRGFHVFMRALPAILQASPDAHVVLVGGNEVSYGPKPLGGGGWQQYMMKEVGQELDMRRVHFVGNLPYARYLNLLQISSAHVYLTYPFVLSWSMLEAMSAECLVIASNTEPVKEVIVDGQNGVLVDFFDHVALAEKVHEALTYPERFESYRKHARKTIIEQYDLRQVCLPRQLELIASLQKKH